MGKTKRKTPDKNSHNKRKDVKRPPKKDKSNKYKDRYE